MTMKMVNSAKDTKVFWREHKRARRSLDKKLASLPYAEKLVIMGKMRAGHMALRNAKRVTKASQISLKT